MSHISINNDPPRDSWAPCRPGEFAELSGRLAGRGRRRAAFRSALGAAVCVLIVAGLAIALRPTENDYHFSGISCSRVRQLASDLKTGKLQPRLRDQVLAHVRQCPHCRARFQAMGMAVSKIDRTLRKNDLFLSELGRFRSERRFKDQSGTARADAQGEADSASDQIESSS